MITSPLSIPFIDIDVQKKYNIYKSMLQRGDFMKRVSTENLVPGMITAEDIYTYSNHLILPKGLVLTDKSITKLEFYSILSIRVEDEISAPETPDDNLSFSQRIQASEEFKEYKQKFENTIDDFKTDINQIVELNADLDAPHLLQHALNLLDGKNGRINVFTMLHNMRNYDDLTYAHSLNVALICNVLAGWMRLSEEDIQTATLAGLLHDMGKMKIPDNIIKKPAKLTANEYNIVKTHAIEGYNLLKNCNVNEHVKNAALMHHERFDGTGYPLGLANEKIDPFARIVAVADVYEAMTSARVYRGPLCPFKVLAIFVSEGLAKYDPTVILPFMKNIVDTYMGNRVRLSTGVEGEIIYFNPQDPSRPTIKCGSNYIDLTQEFNVEIAAII